jgi:hypothetical protein
MEDRRQTLSVICLLITVIYTGQHRQKSEGSSRETEDRGQKTEVQKTE